MRNDHRRYAMAAVSILLFVLSGCVPKGYQQAMDQAVIYEDQAQYEKAYQFYKEALELQPKDKAARAKLDRLGRLISERFTRRAVQAYENKRYQTALDMLKKAMVYDPANSRAAAYTEKAMEQYTRIKAMYRQADAAAAENQWLKAVGILDEIAGSYNDDPDLDNKISQYRQQGYNWYRRQGLDARRQGRYDLSMKQFEAADRILAGPDSAKELALAKDYIQAEKHYWQAREKVSQKEIIAAMDELFAAKELVGDHAGVNRLFTELVPSWSGLMLAAGKQYHEANRPDKAFAAFSKLYSVNPKYPDAASLYLQSRASYLAFNYRNLVRALTENEFQLVNVYAQDVLNVDPHYLDTREIMTRALQKRFSRYYQKGLYYMAGNNDGKAILCFRSAENHLAQTSLTRDRIEAAWAKIRRSSALNIAIWEFFNQIDDPELGDYATGRLNELLRQQTERQGFKNIYFNFDDIRSDSGTYRTVNTRYVDWAALSAAGYNAVITGDIKQLKLEKTVGSQWKVRTRRVRRIVDNPEYAHLEIRKANLNRALNDKKFDVLTPNEAYAELVEKRDETRVALNAGDLSRYKKRRLESELKKLEEKIASTDKDRPMFSTEIKKELEKLTRKLAATPQRIEKEIDEETPYQVVRHVIKARSRIEVQISMPGGRKLWPAKLFEDTLQVEDIVIPPNLNSEDPQEREGDPLSLPSDTEIKKEAIDKVIAGKIFPALLAVLQDYGMRFYERARANDQSQTDPDFPSVAFFNAVEDYFRFMATYKGKKTSDTLVEEVRRKLDGFIDSYWLITGPKIAGRVASATD